MGPGCYDRHWVRENDQSVACILATCKSKKVPARYMLMLTGIAKIKKKKVTSTSI